MANGHRFEHRKIAINALTDRHELLYDDAQLPSELYLQFLSDRYNYGSPYAMGPLSCLFVCPLRWCGQTVG